MELLPPTADPMEALQTYGGLVNQAAIDAEYAAKSRTDWHVFPNFVFLPPSFADAQKGMKSRAFFAAITDLAQEMPISNFHRALRDFIVNGPGGGAAATPHAAQGENARIRKTA